MKTSSKCGSKHEWDGKISFNPAELGFMEPISESSLELGTLPAVHLQNALKNTEGILMSDVYDGLTGCTLMSTWSCIL